MASQKPPELPRSATRDAVVLAAETMLASIVQVLEINGQCCAAHMIRTVAGTRGYVAQVAHEARLDSLHGGRAARIDHLIDSTMPTTET